MIIGLLRQLLVHVVIAYLESLVQWIFSDYINVLSLDLPKDSTLNHTLCQFPTFYFSQQQKTHFSVIRMKARKWMRHRDFSPSCEINCINETLSNCIITKKKCKDMEIYSTYIEYESLSLKKINKMYCWIINRHVNSKYNPNSIFVWIRISLQRQFQLVQNDLKLSLYMLNVIKNCSTR